MFKKAILIFLALVLIFSMGCQQQKTEQAKPLEKLISTSGDIKDNKKNETHNSGEKPVNIDSKVANSKTKEISPSDKKKAEELMKEARDLRFAKKFEEATDKIKKAVEIDPYNEKIYIEYAQLYKSQDDYPAAVKVLEEGIKVNPTDAKLRQSIGKIFKSQRNYKKAIESFIKAKDLEPDELDHYLDLVSAYIRNQDFNKVDEVYHSALRKFPKDFWVHYRYADYLRIKSRLLAFNSQEAEILQQSADYYEKSSKLLEKGNSKISSILKIMATIYYDKWRITRSEEDRKKSLKLFDDFKKTNPEPFDLESIEDNVNNLKRKL